MQPSPPSPPHSSGKWIRWWILPLLLGAATLVLIAKTEKSELEIAVGVTFENLAGDLLITDASRHMARMLIGGGAAALENLDLNTVACRLDLAGLTAGTHTLPVPTEDVLLPKGIVLKSLLTPSLTLRLETVLLKTVGVVAVLEGNPAPGYAVAAVALKPDHVVLKGTASGLAEIDTVKTHPINLEAAAESFKKEVPLNLPETIAVEPPLRIVVAQVEVSERIITRVLENIPVSAKGSTSRHRIHPETIALTVSGPEGIVNAIESDPTFSVTVDLKDLPPGDHTLKASINLPVRTTLIDVRPENFSVTIRKQG